MQYWLDFSPISSSFDAPYLIIFFSFPIPTPDMLAGANIFLVAKMYCQIMVLCRYTFLLMFEGELYIKTNGFTVIGSSASLGGEQWSKQICH